MGGGWGGAGGGGNVGDLEMKETLFFMKSNA